MIAIKPLALLLALTLAVAARAGVITERLTYTVGGVEMQGTLCYDDEKAKSGRVPGVLVCPEWWGVNEYVEGRARMLAEQGYVAFVVDMYGKGKVTSDPKQAGAWNQEVMSKTDVVRARAAAGLKILAEHRFVEGTRLAAIGYCMGGTVALELARSGLAHTEHLQAIVAFHASNVAAKGDDGEAAKDNANIKGSVLICHGAADTFVKPGELDRFQKQMEAAKIDYQVVSYAHAVHAFTNPKAGGYNLDGVAYDRKADKRSWQHMLQLFSEKF